MSNILCSVNYLLLISFNMLINPKGKKTSCRDSIPANLVTNGAHARLCEQLITVSDKSTHAIWVPMQYEYLCTYQGRYAQTRTFLSTAHFPQPHTLNICGTPPAPNPESSPPPLSGPRPQAATTDVIPVPQQKLRGSPAPSLHCKQPSPNQSGIVFYAWSLISQR